MKKVFDIRKATDKAIREFWETKKRQSRKSEDSSSRGAVTAGKQMDGFLALLRDACIAVGVPDSCIYDRNNYIPGFFRSSKDWDFLIITPSNKLLSAIELKSQVGSYGNNFNNRTEEAIGNATDFWTAYREKQFLTVGTPWLGYFMLIGEDKKSTAAVKNYANHFPVLPEFEGASYVDRYEILCNKLMTERLYTSACLLLTKDSKTYRSSSEHVSVERFVKSLQGYLVGCIDEFDR